MSKTVLFLIISFICVTEGVVFSSLPEHLLPCYRSGGPALGAPRRLDVFLSLLKKLEVNHALDMRLFSTSLLRSFRLDGIEEAANAVETEFVTPYRASGFQFNKYKLLMDLFLPTQNLLDPEILSVEEKCLLHVMMSGSVRHWERGDEDRVCPLASEQMQHLAHNESRVISRCPIEVGVIKTDWGTISSGTLIAAVAAALEPQRVAVADILNADVYKADVAEPLVAEAKGEWYSDIETLDGQEQRDVPDISNLYVATLAGDLAEVVVNQGPRVGPSSQRLVIGSNNRWNDTMLPRNYFMYPQNSSNVDWQISDAEILAGIDGLILASYLPTWISQRNSLRLSQVLDMYYSDEGVSFEPRVKACNRQSLFKSIVDSSTLATETSRFAHVLYLTQGGVYIPVEKMNRISDAAVSAFTEYLTTIFSQHHRECKGPSSTPQMNLVIATDGAWKQYDVEQFVSWVGDALELDLERSTLGLLHGNTGRWIAPPAHNLTAVFTSISNFTDDWPNRMNIPNVISTVIQHAQNQSILEQNSTAAISTVVLIISPSDRPSANDIERARELMHSLRSSFFDIYFAYASTDLVPFQNINNEYMDYSEIFLQTESTNVMDAVNAIDLYLKENDLPTRIFGAQCPFNDTVFNLVPYEDFVLAPGIKRSYRIHPFYLTEQPLINVQFRNQGHGELLVCSWRGAEASRNCQTIPQRNLHTFNITTPCASIDFCIPVNFEVSATATENFCANNDCRFPNQVGYYIQHSGLRCLPLRGSASRISLHWKLQLFIYFIIMCIYGLQM
ncbi:uncharacterized protein LOC125225796 isoform X2 [Leguminivora glycinivorella]|uniref:uncharacterized protein LOC125225796 isoform X2 n=1 Tax=Leguminivora glycinivorella TaxID=1035111 RepID=UPI002010629D|nr:uncharacterized protein LOC125225796 isoform X2 [Leguminivora glycinivorella]